MNPDQAAILRGELYNQVKKLPRGFDDRNMSGAQNEHRKTAQYLASKYSVGQATIRRDGKLAEAGAMKGKSGAQNDHSLTSQHLADQYGGDRKSSGQNVHLKTAQHLADK